MIGTLGLLVDDGIEQFVIYGAFLVGMVYIDKIEAYLGMLSSALMSEII